MDAFALALISLSLIVSVPREMPGAERAELLSGCSHALAPETCVTDPNAPPQAWVESVENTRLTLTVELADASTRGSATRELSFGPNDEPLARARAAGLSLGLMAKALQSDRPPEDEQKPEQRSAQQESGLAPTQAQLPSSADAQTGLLQEQPLPRPPPKRNRPAYSPRDAQPRASQYLSLGAEGGIYVDPGLATVEGGGLVRVESRPFAVLGFVVSADLRAGQTNVVWGGGQDDALAWLRFTPTMGTLLSGQWRNLEFLAQLEGGAQALQVEVSGKQSSASKWVPAFRAGMSLRLPASARVRFSLTPRVTWRPLRANVYVWDELVRTTAAFSGSVDLGVYWSPTQPKRAPAD